MNFDFDSEYSIEWRQLGFYYDFDNKENCWRLTGPKRGLFNFCNLLKEYVNNPSHAGLSEHEHYGPDSYLKIVTWTIPIIKEDGIYGTLDNIENLEVLLRNKLLSNSSTEIIIDKEYSKQNECFILIKIMNEDFDPSSLM